MERQDTTTAWSPEPGHLDHSRPTPPNLPWDPAAGWRGGRRRGGTARQGSPHPATAAAFWPLSPRSPVRNVTRGLHRGPAPSLPNHASLNRHAASPPVASPRLSPGRRHCYDRASSAVKAREAERNVSQPSNAGSPAQGRAEASPPHPGARPGRR